MSDFPTYVAPPWLQNGHWQTIWPSLFRHIKAKDLGVEEERMELADGDFLDVDWYRRGNKRLAIIGHGLEGNSRRCYVVGMARCLLQAGWDVLAWNCRACGREVNRKLILYHSGKSDDLDQVVRYADKQGYDSLVLVGSSMGGNLILKYLGEPTYRPHLKSLKAAVTYSVPCDLQASCEVLDKKENRLYTKRFLRKLRKKLRQKAEQFPDEVDLKSIKNVRSFIEFDDQFTAPWHGFSDALDYHTKASCKQFIRGIKIPTLIFNAKNDPFLDDSCHPIEEAKANPNVTFELLEEGGHVGFSCRHPDGHYWSELRTLAFIEAHVPASDNC